MFSHEILAKVRIKHETPERLSEVMTALWTMFIKEGFAPQYTSHGSPHLIEMYFTLDQAERVVQLLKSLDVPVGDTY